MIESMQCVPSPLVGIFLVAADAMNALMQVIQCPIGRINFVNLTSAEVLLTFKTSKPRSNNKLTLPYGLAAFPWASCIAVGSALGTNAIEFIAGQLLHTRALKAATAAAASGHDCGREHSLEVLPPALHPEHPQASEYI